MQEVMTNEQMYTFLKMIEKIVEKCADKEEIVKEIKSLQKDYKEDNE